MTPTVPIPQPALPDEVYERGRDAALRVLTNGEPTSGEIVDALTPVFAAHFAAERDALAAQIEAAPHGSLCESRDGRDCSCWKCFAPASSVVARIREEAWDEGYAKAEDDHGATGFYQKSWRANPYRQEAQQ